MMKPMLLLIMLAAASQVLGGCGGGYFGNDRSHLRNENWNTNYVQGQLYEVMEPVYVMRSDYPAFGDTRYDMAPDSAPYMGWHGKDLPHDVNEYRASPQRWPKAVVLLEPGSRVRFEKLRVRHGSVTYGRDGVPLGVIVQDNLSDLGLVNMLYISDQWGKVDTTNVDPKYLRPVTE